MSTPLGSHSWAGVQRFLEDLRSVDRRTSWDRRSDGHSAPSERREGSDRRHADRRRQDYEQFALSHVASIQAMIMDEAVAAACPECEGNLMLGPAMDRGGFMARRVQCTGCYRRGLIRDEV